MKASEIDWAQTWFVPDEFPRGELDYACAEVVLRLNEIRNHFMRPVWPSPAPGALARSDGSKTSRHYAVGRLSDAVDFFTDAPPLGVWSWMMGRPNIGGIGIYFDTRFRGRAHTMLHLDLRPGRVMWLRFRKILKSGPQSRYVSLNEHKPRPFWLEFSRQITP